jgi:hypothetical protein
VPCEGEKTNVAASFLAFAGGLLTIETAGLGALLALVGGAVGFVGNGQQLKDCICEKYFNTPWGQYACEKLGAEQAALQSELDQMAAWTRALVYRGACYSGSAHSPMYGPWTTQDRASAWNTAHAAGDYRTHPVVVQYRTPS